VIEDQATDEPARIGIAAAAPDLGLSSQIQREIEHAIFQIFDSIKVGDLAPVMDGDADGG
jgi:hypothetical protein